MADVEDMKATKDKLAIYDDVGRLAKALVVPWQQHTERIFCSAQMWGESL